MNDIPNGAQNRPQAERKPAGAQGNDPLAKAGSRRRLLAAAAVGGAAALFGAHEFEALGEGGRFKKRGFSRAMPIPSDAGALPKAVDVAIIGGGFAGVCAALSLSQRGVSVAVLEKGVVAGEASGRSAGMIESLLNAPSQLELIEYSKSRWRDLNRVTGEETTFVQAGNTLLYEDERGLAEARAWLESVNSLPHAGARMLNAAEAAALMPESRKKMAGGLHAPEDGGADPRFAVPMIARGARKFGAKIYQNCAVRGIETTGGRVSGVVTERGAIKTPTVVIAGGVWSPILARQLGVALPLIQGWVSMASMLPFENAPPPGSVSLLGPNVGWRRQFDGGYGIWQFAAIGPVLPDGVANFGAFMPLLRANWSLVGLRFSADTFARWLRFQTKRPLEKRSVFEEVRIYEPQLRGEIIDAGIARLQDTIPAFRKGAVAERWTGAMSMTPDTKPVLSTVEQRSGLIMATGFYHGLTVGPGVGEIVADIATGKEPKIDISQFAHKRLVDHRKLSIYS